jgi:iron complex transport system substrate-binding protein
VVGHDPLFVSGAGTFLDDLLVLANAENACENVRGWARYGLEDFLARNPEVILDSTMGNEREADDKVVAFWSRWTDLAAVKGGRVHAIDPDLTNRPGPRIVQALEHLARHLHPDAFVRGTEGGR